MGASIFAPKGTLRTGEKKRRVKSEGLGTRPTLDRRGLESDRGIDRESEEQHNEKTRWNVEDQGVGDGER